jgi:hypothetical protein
MASRGSSLKRFRLKIGRSCAPIWGIPEAFWSVAPKRFLAAASRFAP